MRSYRRFRQKRKPNYRLARSSRFRSNRYHKPIERSLTAFPKTNVVRMRYADQLTLGDPINPLQVNVFRANSIFDPDFTIGGHQPLGHDQWSPFYNRYQVIGSKLTIQGVAASAVGVIPIIYGIYVSSNSNFIASDVYQFIEQGKSKWRLLQNQVNGNVPGRCVEKYSQKRWMGLKDNDDCDETKADFGNNPSLTNYFHVWAGTQDKITHLDPVQMCITIDFIVRLLEPDELPQS